MTDIDERFQEWKDKYNDKLIHFSRPAGESYALTQNEIGLMYDAWHEADRQATERERKRLLEIFKPWLDSMSPEDRKAMMYCINKELVGIRNSQIENTRGEK